MNNDFQGLISCGSDARIRYWDLMNPYKSYVIVDNFFKNSSTVSNLTSGQSNSPNLNRSTNVNYISKFIEGIQLIQEYDHQTQSPTSPNQQTAQKDHLNSTSNFSSYNNWDPQDISPAHKNIITDVIWLNKSNLLVSASKDGCVKLWK